MTMPEEWGAHTPPPASPWTDASIYELHIRDFRYCRADVLLLLILSTSPLHPPPKQPPQTLTAFTLVALQFALYGQTPGKLLSMSIACIITRTGSKDSAHRVVAAVKACTKHWFLQHV